MIGPILIGAGAVIVAGSLFLNRMRPDFGKPFDLVGLLWLLPIGFGAALMVVGGVLWGVA